MDPDRLAALRRQYVRTSLSPEDLDPDPVVALVGWLGEAVDAADAGLVVEPNAMILSTADASGAPSSRTVLLKAVDQRGLVFYTNFTSRKVREIEENPRAALLFPWYSLSRQVAVSGTVLRVDAAESAAYFRARPWASRIGAWVSRQSSVIAGREVLDERFQELAARWPEATEVPVPDFWGGLRVVPLTVEFWQGRADRLHDRVRYERAAPGEPWSRARLAP